LLLPALFSEPAEFATVAAVVSDVNDPLVTMLVHVEAVSCSLVMTWLGHVGLCHGSGGKIEPAT
jgi:hypothetical protein